MKLYLHCNEDPRNCGADIFLINGVEADEDDFGETIIEGDGEYGIKSVTFTRRKWDVEALQGVPDKYGIREDEFNEVCDRLTDGLTWGAHK